MLNAKAPQSQKSSNANNAKIQEMRSEVGKPKMETAVSKLNELYQKGYTKEYGAREMDRVINHELNPILIKQILFGDLQQGGEAIVTSEDGSLKITAKVSGKR